MTATGLAPGVNSSRAQGIHPGIRESGARNRMRRILAHPVRTVAAAFSRLSNVPLENLPDSPDLFRGYRVWSAHPEVRRRPGGWEYREKFYPDYLTVGGACHAIFPVARQYCRGNGADIGAGLWPLPDAVPIDVWRGPGASETISQIAAGSLDFVFSSHCLEHNENWQETLQEWIGKLKRGGTLFLYLPHPECGIWEPGSPFVGTGHKWVPTPALLKTAIAEFGCELVAHDDGPDAMFSFWICARKR
jgi:hypothetical protein